MIKSYAKKPVVVQAVQYTGKNFKDVATLCTHGFSKVVGTDEIVIHTSRGDERAKPSDYIVCGSDDEPYVICRQVFEDMHCETEACDGQR